MSDGPFIYGLLAYKNSLLFTKLPFSLFSKPSKPAASSTLASSTARNNNSKACLGDAGYSKTDAAILDLIQYYHLVNMCVSARVAKSEALLTDITYTAAPAPAPHPPHPLVADTASSSTTAIVFTKPVPVQTPAPPRKQPRDPSKQSHPSPRRIRRYLMRADISLACFERSFLNELMLLHFESPFEDSSSTPSPSPASSAASSPSTSPSTSPSSAASSPLTSPTTSVSSSSSLSSVNPDYDLDRSMIIELVKPATLHNQGSSKTQLSAILEKCASSMTAREHSRETRRESFWRRFFGDVL